MKEQIIETIDTHRSAWKAISQDIGKRPELGGEEVFASKTLTETLEAHGFKVERAAAGVPTAFHAVYESGKEGGHIGLMCEYDALPDLGHACGHNLIGTQGVAAAIGLKSAADQAGGTIHVFGTPAEETNGAKVTMADAGMFDQLDAALMAHPADAYVKSGSSLAMDAIELSFHGKSAHAAAAPEYGINALDAVLQTFNSINARREHLRDDVKIHGIISAGGQAPNIVPDYAAAKFYVRAASRETCNDAAAKLISAGEGAALASGARLEVSYYEYSYDNLITNERLSELFTDQLESLGIAEKNIQAQDSGGGSLDMGNVSQRCPAIHPYIQISRDAVQPHTPEFRTAALSEQGFEGMIIGAKALALTGAHILNDPELRAEIHREFSARL
ncbi:M20 family metallopeptidase [Salisediminibacterium halotolerans]|uniref:Peptidase M20 domain-containing protein 2 n=1 Tax=Salisediminibacterium halotolerans TaxID=517425 RepID=A0A1H9W8F1_9BACI|nr:M20 family metallopeptidase [Salisediminibacterium haloalkalitolerans]SES30125.1 amidohydrolase [Salisediminibacterium haloalkalitolerans]